MKEKILKIVGEEFRSDFNKNAIGAIVEKNNNIGFSLDIDFLEISKNEAEKLTQKLQQRIKQENPNLQKVSIVVTAQKGHKIDESVAKKSSEETKKPEIDDKNNTKKVAAVKKIIAVASAKGGVGKSTISVNLALSLKKIGYNIALVDADIYGPSIPHLLNINENPQIKNNLIIPHDNFGIKTISIGSLVDSSKAGIWRGPMTNKILHQLIRQVNWSFDGKEVDIMIVDMPPGTGDIYLSLAENFAVDGAVIISTPQSLSVIDVVKSIDMFNKLEIKIIGIVQNMSYLENNGNKQYLFGKDGAKKLASEQKLDFLGEIAIDEKISKSGEERNPIVTTTKSTQISLEFGKIAENIIDRLS